jgi:phage shock protein PspC (stress-responsive transcriptional regulator)
LLATATAVAFAVPLAAARAAKLDANELGLNEIGSNLGLSTEQNVKAVIANIIRVLLGFLGLIAVVLVLYAGFQWMTAAGNEEKVATAQSTLRAGLIGLVIILAAFAIASFIINTILNET